MCWQKCYRFWVAYFGMILTKFYGNLSDASIVIKTQRHVTTNKSYVTECTLFKDTFNCNEVNSPSPKQTQHWRCAMAASYNAWRERSYGRQEHLPVQHWQQEDMTSSWCNRKLNKYYSREQCRDLRHTSTSVVCGVTATYTRWLWFQECQC